MKTWVVSSGEYSDYRVHAAFTTKDAADETARAANEVLSQYDAIEVEQMDLYDAPVLPVTVYKRTGAVHADGAADGIESSSEMLLPWSWGYTPAAAEVRMFHGFLDGKPERITVRVTGLDSTAVDRAFTERVARLRAEWAVTFNALYAEFKGR